MLFCWLFGNCKIQGIANDETAQCALYVDQNLNSLDPARLDILLKRCITTKATMGINKSHFSQITSSARQPASKKSLSAIPLPVLYPNRKVPRKSTRAATHRRNPGPSFSPSQQQTCNRQKPRCTRSSQERLRRFIEGNRVSKRLSVFVRELMLERMAF